MGKKLSQQAVRGQFGVNVVEEAILGMGFKWSPGNGSLDTGLDGDIELVDPVTRDAQNVVIRAQVKGRTALDNETDRSFEFTCSKEDIDYWMAGNVPVILIIVKLRERLAWWVSVRDCFADANRRKSGKAVFDKKYDRFDKDTGPRLLALCQNYGAATYFVPKRKKERLISNLLSVTRLPASLFMAETAHRDPKELRDRLRQDIEYPDREWMLRDGWLYSVHNLRRHPWNKVCDVGTVENIDTDEWAWSDVPEARNGFIRLLKTCLWTRVAKMRMRWDATEGCYHFRATQDLSPFSVHYTSLQQRTSRVVFQGYPSKVDPSRMAYYRHVGFEPRFLRLAEEWYLEITPRYLFTTDGETPHPFREEYQAKIKTFEGGAAVRGTVVMFAALLQDESTLYRQAYPHLGFGKLVTAETEVGIDDDAWSNRDELRASAGVENDSPGLFDA